MKKIVFRNYKAPTAHGTTITLNRPYLHLGWDNTIELPKNWRINLGARFSPRGDVGYFRLLKAQGKSNLNQMQLRLFNPDDAATILSWCKDKTAFRKWSADRYSMYPPKPEDMAALYATENVFPFTAIDDEGTIVGHIMLRYPEPSKTVVRFGFVIIDDQLRGKGYGKQMLQLAIQKAQQEFGARKITLGVFENNPSAFHCYESVGFVVTGIDTYAIDGEEWSGKEMELVIKNNLSLVSR